MKRFSVISLFFALCVSSFAQHLDTADMRISYFGIPSQAPDPDFVKTQTAVLNAYDMFNENRLDSLKDGKGVIIVDSIRTGGFVLTDTYFDDLRVPLTNTKLTPTKSEPIFEDMGNGVLAYGFDADADSTEALHFVAQVPHSWKEGTDIDAHIHWAPSTTHTGDVLWKMKVQVAGIGSAFSVIDSFYITDAGDGVAFKHQYLDMGHIPADSIGSGVSALIVGSVARVGEDAADTYTGSAYGIEIDFHYQIDGFGSPEEVVKGY